MSNKCGVKLWNRSAVRERSNQDRKQQPIRCYDYLRQHRIHRQSAILSRLAISFPFVLVQSQAQPSLSCRFLFYHSLVAVHVLIGTFHSCCSQGSVPKNYRYYIFDLSSYPKSHFTAGTVLTFTKRDKRRT